MEAPLNKSSGKVGLYCLDQNRETTSSLGIYNYTRHLIRALADIDDPGFELTVWVTKANGADFQPEKIPSWMKLCCRGGTNQGTGLRRLWADHFVAAWLSGQSGIDLIHYPKGWMPVPSFGRVKTIITLHDVFIPFPPSPLRSLGKLLHYWYFQVMIRNSLAKAGCIVTDSQFSATEILRRNGKVAEKLIVSYLGPGISLSHQTQPQERHYKSNDSRLGPFLILGSHAPHKFTGETLQLLSHWSAKKGVVPEVTIASLSDWPAAFGQRPKNLSLNFVGRVSDSQLEQLMRQSRALLYLSLTEGFGLPAVESYYSGTPVCYRTGTSVAEILFGIKGGWDGADPKGFCQALDDILAMSGEEVQVIRRQIVARYDWSQYAQRMAATYRNALHGTKPQS